MSLLNSVVCLGLPKTGTTTLIRSLKILDVDNFKVGDHIHLSENYPKSEKYILTTRISVDVWFESVLRWNKKVGHLPHIRNQRVLMYGSAEPEKYWKTIYKNHNKIARLIPNCLEVCWENGDGWEKICDFLDKPIPNVSFPHKNKS